MQKPWLGQSNWVKYAVLHTDLIIQYFSDFNYSSYDL